MSNIIKNTSNIKKYQLVYVEHWPIEKQYLPILIKGILIRATDEVESLAATLNQAPLIAVDFSNFDDGRSYSQVKLLRKVVGYVGEIKALNAHIDHLQFIFRSGVDSYELLPEYQKYHSDYALDFDVCYQAAENNTGLVEKYKLGVN